VAQERIGKYLIEGELGRGAMGVVYRARDPDTGRAVAIKVLPNQLASDAAFVNRFRREIVTLRRLDHPGIIRVLDQGTSDGAHFYVMECVEGRTLKARLEERRRLDLLEATDLVLAVARVLEHIHACGVIHRDLKPSNIMLTREGQVKVTDFGIAKLVDATRMTATQGLLGTVEYMAPEQSQGRFVDPRADIYSLGVIYYRCVTGRVPISGTTTTEVLANLRAKQVERPIEWVPDIPPALSDLIMTMLEKDPARRVPSAKALVRELIRIRGRLIEEREGRAPVVSEHRIIRAAPPGRLARARRVWAPACLLALAAAVWGGYALTRPADPGEIIARAMRLAEAGTEESEREAKALLEQVPPERHTPASRRTLETLRQKLGARSLVRRLYLMAHTVAKRGREALARDLYRLIVQHFPDDPLADDAAGKAAEIEHRLSRPARPGTEDSAREEPSAEPKADPAGRTPLSSHLKESP